LDAWYSISAYCPRPGYFCVLVADVTERHRMEAERARMNQELAARNEELREHRKHLEEEVESRTRELREAQADLLRQERLAMLGRVVATVSHDIRNPLSTIKSSLAILDEAVGDLPPVARRAIDRTHRSVKRTDGIIEELLDQTREPTLQMEEIELAGLVNGALEDLRLPPGIELQADVDAGVCVEVDAVRMQRCLQNVVKNAVEALEEGGGGLIRVSAGLAGDQPVIEVADDGPGISPEHLDRIFEPLFSRKRNGTGLGMAIVKRIVESHGGEVTVESEHGTGTAVRMALPAGCLPARAGQSEGPSRG
jgi:signal transduction histidine kinase